MAPIVVKALRRSGIDHTVLPANNYMPAYLVSVHQMASPLIIVADI